MLNTTGHEFSTAHTNREMLKSKIFPAFKLSDVVFILLINVKMPTIVCWHFNIYEQDKSHVKLR